MGKKLSSIKSEYTCFVEQGGKIFPSPPFVTKQTIQPGIYTVGSTMGGQNYLEMIEVTTDALVPIDGGVSEKIIEEVTGFWNEEVKSKFEDFGLVYKRGILLHGLPGTGKTCTVARIMEKAVASGAIVLFNSSPTAMIPMVNAIRSIMGNVKILAVYEEFDGWLRKYEEEFLSLLDGQTQLENIVYLATTNFIDKIPARLKNRPSRFASVYEVKYPDVNSRKVFIARKLDGRNYNETEWLAVTEGMSLDHIKDLIVSVYCIGITLTEAAEKINQLSSLELEDEDSKDDFNSAYNFLKSISVR